MKHESTLLLADTADFVASSGWFDDAVCQLFSLANANSLDLTTLLNNVY